MNITAGTTIRYQTSDGEHTATVLSIEIGPTAQPNHSIAWLNLLVHNTASAPVHKICLAGDASALQMFKVEVIN